MFRCSIAINTRQQHSAVCTTLFTDQNKAEDAQSCADGAIMGNSFTTAGPELSWCQVIFRQNQTFWWLRRTQWHVMSPSSGCRKRT
jgi:hypothetical protein